MSLATISILMVPGCTILLVLVTTLTGYRWGVFAAAEARAQESPKWQAYLLTLLPPAAFALTLLLDHDLSPAGYGAFFTLAAPAFVGACFRYNREQWWSHRLHQG